MPAKDGRAVEGKVKRLGELRRGVAEETDLCTRQGLDSYRVRRELDTGRGEDIIAKKGKMKRGRGAKTGGGRGEEEGGTRSEDQHNRYRDGENLIDCGVGVKIDERGKGSDRMTVGDLVRGCENVRLTYATFPVWVEGRAPSFHAGGISVSYQQNHSLSFGIGESKDSLKAWARGMGMGMGNGKNG